MKTIKLFFLPIVLILIVNVAFAQDEFYNDSSNNSKNQDETELTTVAPIEDVNTYTTEQDYVLSDDETTKLNQEEITQEEIFEEEERRKRRKEANAQFIGEVVFEVFINAAFIVATFWQ